MEYFAEGRLLTKAPPVKRAAYSDRTAWLLAEIARLVYEPLPTEITVTSLVTEIKGAVEKGDHLDVIEALISRAIAHDSSVDSQVATELRKAKFELLDTFAVDGTEALLAKLDCHDTFEGMLVLAFRGTQPSIKDIRTDLKAELSSAPQGGRVHQGFMEAFHKVEKKIAASLEKHKGLPVYIAGHSLGGALAIIATRYLGSDSTGATYTFGCPRVGDDEFFKPIKTPVYRVVNAADGVPRVPIGYALNILLAVIRLIPFNGTRLLSEWLRRTFSGYSHWGSLIFLSAPPNIPDESKIPFKGLKVKKSPDIFWRISVVLKRIITTRGKALGSDHRMQEYSQKLLAHALRRN